MKTNSSSMEALFDLLANEMADQLENGKQAIDKASGEAVRVSPDAATLNAIRQFLKDNGVQVLGNKSPVLGKLASQLPFGDEVHDDAERPFN